MFDKLKQHCQAHRGKAKMILITLLLSVVVIFMIFETRNVIRRYGYIGRAPLSQYTVTISGEGKETGAPDVAIVDLGVTSEATTVKSAQADNTKKMNDIIKAVKDLKVKDADIQTTNYNIYPKYSYESKTGVSSIVGYTVSQSVRIKVRNLDDTGTIISKAGELGANQVSGVQFTLDDSEKLKSQAREKAIDNAKSKADDLFKKLGVKVGRIVSFSEYSSDGSYPKYAEYGVGGGGSVTPSIQTGSLDITINVSLTFEIK